MPEIKRLIENDLERGGNEVNKLEISEDDNIENEVPNEEPFDEEVKVPRYMSESLENKTILDEESLEDKNDNIKSAVPNELSIDTYDEVLRDMKRSVENGNNMAAVKL